ncbi:MAG: LuxR C-terminal-related transcriptional regulator [Terriglobia bacterium]
MNNDYRATPIAIAAEEPIVRYGVRRLFETEPDLNVVGEAADSSEAIKIVLDLKPEVLLLELPASRSGLEVLRRLASVKSGARTLLLASPGDRSQIAEAFNLGARGVVLKGSETRILVNGVRGVLAGQYWMGETAVAGISEAIRSFTEQHRNGGKASQDYRLTPRELEIIASIATGCSNKDAGRKFSITERTVKHHLTNIYDKLGVSSRLELALFAVNHHLDVYEPPATRARLNTEEKYAELV